MIIRSVVHSVITIATLLFCNFSAYADSTALPDTLVFLNISGQATSNPLDKWEHIIPKARATTNYSIEAGESRAYLRILSSATNTWLEYKTPDISFEEYSTMEWNWIVNQFPETEWEQNEKNDDHAIRIELVFDQKGCIWNPFNMVRKGLINTLFRRFAPELVISYVWALNVPADEPFESPTDHATIILPIESAEAMQGRWVSESRNIGNDLKELNTTNKNLVLKRIRIRGDTESVPTIAESGIQYLRLIRGNAE